MLRPALFENRKPVLLEDSWDSMFDDMFKNFWGDSTLGRFEGFSTDVIDQGDHYQLEAELPGFDKEDIHIDLKNDMLTISASHNEESEDKDKKHHYIRKERRSSSYSRSFRVENLEAADISASYNNGILEVSIPKKEIAPKEETKRIEIK